MQLSEHFTLDELTASATAQARGIDNTPNGEEMAHLQDLCRLLLEPARQLLGGALYINSGFRCPALNTLVGGVINSAHLDGRAADVTSSTTTTAAAFQRLAVSDLPFDQLIHEHNERGNTWIHLALAPEGQAPRRQVLTLTQRPPRVALG